MIRIALPWFALSACAEWPRLAHVPSGGRTVAAGVDPGDLVDLTWTTQTEGSIDNDQPNTPDLGAQPVARGHGVVFEGSLDGIGWADAATALPLSDDNCPGTVGTRSPLEDGDYTGDVDFLLVEIGAAGTLCASVKVDATSVGWDLAPHAVDPCGTPLGVLRDDEDLPVGVDLGGASGGWSVNVESGTYALGFAGYSPTDPAQVVVYSVGVALVEPRSDGAAGVCPTHSDGGS